MNVINFFKFHVLFSSLESTRHFEVQWQLLEYLLQIIFRFNLNHGRVVILWIVNKFLLESIIYLEFHWNNLRLALFRLKHIPDYITAVPTCKVNRNLYDEEWFLLKELYLNFSKLVSFPSF